MKGILSVIIFPEKNECPSCTDFINCDFIVDDIS